MLIIQEEEDTVQPYANDYGGIITLGFIPKAVYVYEIGLMSIHEETTLTVVYHDESGMRVTKDIDVPLLGDNSIQVVHINLPNVRKVMLTLTCTGSVTFLTFCPGRTD